MIITIDENKKLAAVYCTHADQESEEVQKTLNDFIAECRSKKIFVCVFDSGDGDLLENTGELLAYNFNNAARTSNLRSRDGNTL